MEVLKSKMLTPKGIPKHYYIYREGFTIFVQNTKEICADLQNRLKECGGEIFLCNIPHWMTVHELATVLLQVGDFYLLRFKVNYAGMPRSFAYLQFMDPDRIEYDINHLLHIFKDLNWHIHVFRSKNLTTLVLRDVDDEFSPFQVYEMVCKLVKYKKFRALEYAEDCFVYHVEFSTNENAVIGKRELVKARELFGSQAHVIWLDVKKNDIIQRNSSCCYKFEGEILTSVAELEKIFAQGCNCFKF